MAEERIRLDRWLWAARFFKTRSLAGEAVAGGKVHLNGERTKPAHPIRVGDEVTVRRGIDEAAVIVRGVAKKRGGAAEAARLYEETEESRLRRERLATEARLRGALHEGGRPTKQDRRELRRLRRSLDD